MEEVIKIINDIKAGTIKPIYFLMGEEAYYIDKLTEYIENNILTEDERGFNQMVLYGRDTTINEIVSNAKRYPMMADRQVIIVREAQDLVRTIDQLESYAENPQPTTVLVMAYKYKTIDKRKKISKTLAKNGVVFESKKLYENQVGTWIQRVLKGKGYGIDFKASAMLVEFLGNDLGKISNELDKLQIILPKGHTFTPNDIEVNIGFSKDYNNFELRKAIGERDEVRAYRIAENFAQNPKDNPIIVTTAMVFSYFSQLLQFHGLKDKSAENVAKVLGINKFFAKDYELAAKNFPMKKVSANVAVLRDIDVKSKGVGANALPTGDLLKEMLFKIFN
ncbi:DNA polymerase III subunit delta [Flavobacterium sp. SUN046]|uniref:DNA polymerase III subunit delta n=1 Tax=Flavobacterium sp. SUN046 TaxID=3002440 RepID=UPI002DBCEACC|nr:DNA polymerase III subunit delta [Flavobacterium sp. SUN046]MEC4048486.1 DNA polymerase III subunit delta [Flavobacterium sp. SUN046]